MFSTCGCNRSLHVLVQRSNNAGSAGTAVDLCTSFCVSQSDEKLNTSFSSRHYCCVLLLQGSTILSLFQLISQLMKD